MKNILVTGGLGFIGSNLCKKLLQSKKNKVTIVDDLSSCRTDYKDLIKEFSDAEILITCYSDKILLDRVKSKEFSTVFHVAANPRVGYSVDYPHKTTDVNVTRTVALIEACIGNINRFIFSSSSSVYGDNELLPTSTDTRKKPKSPYAWHKSSIEDLLGIFSDLHSFDSVCLRYFNVFGPGQYGGTAYSTAVAAWCDAIKNEKSLRSDGTGEQSRDMCYVDNVVDANVLAMNYDKKFKADCFNIGCGSSTTNNEILDYMIRQYPKIEIKNAPFRPGDVMHTLADISKSEKILGYKPNVNFWEGLERTLRWWKI